MTNAMLQKSGCGEPNESPDEEKSQNQSQEDSEKGDAKQGEESQSDGGREELCAGKQQQKGECDNDGPGISLKEHDFVGGGSKAGPSRVAENLDFGPRTKETELRLGLGPPELDRAPSEPKFFNNGQEVAASSAFLLPSKNLSVGVAGAKRVFSELQSARMSLQLGNESEPNVAPMILGSSPGAASLPVYSWSGHTPANGPPFASSTANGGVVLISEPPHVGPSETRADAKRPPLPPSATSADFLHKNSSPPPPRVAPVVGWPPIRTFRKNLAPHSKLPNNANLASSKTVSFQAPLPPPPPPPPHPESAQALADSMFVKVNMDGVPIGRKIDLKAFNGYAQFLQALEEMFKRYTTVQGSAQKATPDLSSESEQPFVFLGGDYVLTYEDNEGDRMLVGDVPWEMFVSTVKRLRIMKSSEARCLGSQMQKK
eukprot:TRINITY_DN330_c1_g1_i2.p1 TRINITY_DN330_c1_g1~~TRINITY_DN330_c1_g1_i2.p1  ORF type:complete len:429 (-),score=62.66 TRINITY_DN330_c1_g1_i2:542-1828(-)